MLLRGASMSRTTHSNFTTLSVVHLIIAYPSIGLLLVSLVFVAAFGKSPIHASSYSQSHMQHQHDISAHAAHDHGGMVMDMAMPMYFENTWRTILWFKSWETKDLTSYIISLVGLVLFGIVHEALACYRSSYIKSVHPKEDAASGRRTTALSERIVLALLYMGNITTGYLLMLAVMSFNVGYFFAVILGLGLGYFLLYDKMSGHSMMRSDSCHVRLIDDE